MSVDDPRPPSERPPASGEGQPEHRDEKRRRLEDTLRETFRRAVERSVEAGVETFSKASKAPRAVRDAVDGVVEDVPLPREIVSFLFSQVDDTKNVLVRVVAKEVRDFLEATDLADTLQRALTSLSFEIKTEVRFIPNDAGGIRPQVRAKATPKTEGRKDKWRRNKSEPPPEGDEGSPEAPDD